VIFSRRATGSRAGAGRSPSVHKDSDARGVSLFVAPEDVRGVAPNDATVPPPVVVIPVPEKKNTGALDPDTRPTIPQGQRQRTDSGFSSSDRSGDCFARAGDSARLHQTTGRDQAENLAT